MILDRYSIIAVMIPRRISSLETDRLRQFPAVALLGPRQVGKTTLSRLFLDSTEYDYLDLENPVDRAKLDDAPAYLSSRQGRLLIIDEVQRMSGLFQILRGVIDERILPGDDAGHFLLLGSASIFHPFLVSIQTRKRMGDGLLRMASGVCGRSTFA